MQNKQGKNSTGEALDEVLAERPSLIFPEGKDSIEYVDIDRVIGALRIYGLVREYLQNGTPIFDNENDDEDETWDFADTDDYTTGTTRGSAPTNEDVLSDMNSIYVFGYGNTPIGGLKAKPLITGKILNLRIWEALGEDVTVYNMDIYGALAIVAEMVARQQTVPYDVTCMQLRNYETIRFGMQQKTTPTHSSNLAAEIMHRNLEARTSRLMNPSVAELEYADMAARQYTDNIVGDCLDDPRSAMYSEGHIITLMELSVDEYDARRGYYMTIHDRHQFRTRTGKMVYERAIDE